MTTTKLTYPDFYKVATYLNENANNCYTKEEVEQNANNYFSDYKTDIKNCTTSGTTKFLLEELEQEKEYNEHCKHMFETMREELSK